MEDFRSYMINMVEIAIAKGAGKLEFFFDTGHFSATRYQKQIEDIVSELIKTYSNVNIRFNGEHQKNLERCESAVSK